MFGYWNAWSWGRQRFEGGQHNVMNIDVGFLRYAVFVSSLVFLGTPVPEYFCNGLYDG